VRRPLGDGRARKKRQACSGRMRRAGDLLTAKRGGGGVKKKKTGGDAVTCRGKGQLGGRTQEFSGPDSEVKKEKEYGKIGGLGKRAERGV